MNTLSHAVYMICPEAELTSTMYVLMFLFQHERSSISTANQALQNNFNARGLLQPPTGALSSVSSAGSRAVSSSLSKFPCI